MILAVCPQIYCNGPKAFWTEAHKNDDVFTNIKLVWL